MYNSIEEIKEEFNIETDKTDDIIAELNKIQKRII